MRTRGEVPNACVEFLRNRTGEEMHFNDIAEAMGEDKTVVNNALADLARKATSPIHRTNRGVYVYRSIQKIDDTEVKIGHVALYEIIGIGRDGTIFVRDENQKLFKLSRV